MRLLKALVVAATTLSVVAGPIRFNRRGQDPNILVLQFASVLEDLESQFYQQGIQKFSDSDFQSAGFTSTAIVSEQLTTIQGDEATHLDFLKKALSSVGSSAPDSCQFNFDSALTDVATMAATARIVELVGVGAYLGAASLITDPQILVAAGSILTVEARHQTVLNAMSGIGSPIPQPFDIALAPGEVLAIAGGFIQGCDLGIPANKPLTVTNSAPPQIGDLVQFSFDGMSNMNNLHCQMLLPGSVNSVSLAIDQCIVPQGVDGPVAIFITADQQPLANNVVLRPMANNIVAGPVIAFIDSEPSALSQLLRAGASSGGVSDTSSVITPDQAGQIVSEGQSSSSSEDGPNFSTGTEAGGIIIVNGWTNLPGQDLSGQNENQDNSMSYGQDSNSMQSGDSMDSMQSGDSMDSMQSGDSMDSMQSGDSMDSMQSGDSMDSMQSEDSMNSMDQNMNQDSGSMQSEDSMNMNSYQSQDSGSMQSEDSMNSDQNMNSDSMQSEDSMNSMQSDDSMQNQDMNNNQDSSSFDLSGSSSDSSTEAPASSDGSS